MLPLWDDIPRRRTAAITAILIAVNLGVFLYEGFLLTQGGSELRQFLVEYSLVPKRFVAHFEDGGQWLTVLTSMFLHGGVSHVLGNCWFLWVFGRSVEDRLGGFIYLMLYLGSGFGAACLQTALDLTSPIPMLGASGAISGVLGAYLALCPTAWVFTLVPWIVPVVPLPAFLLLIAWFGLQALNGVGMLLNDDGAGGGVAWWAHAGGFVTGFLASLWFKSRGLVRRR